MNVQSDVTSVENSQAVIARTERPTGVMWYVDTFRNIVWEGWGEVRNNDLVNQNIRQVGVGMNQLSAKVSEVAGVYISNIKSSVNPAEFFRLLNRTHVQEIFNVELNGTYETNLLKYRETLKNGLDPAKKNMAVQIFHGLGMSSADRILRPYLSDGSNDLSVSFKLDREAIKKITPQIGQGMLPWIWNIVAGGVRLFDPIKDGNFPFLIGTRKIEGKEVKVLRHPLPTVEFGSISVAPEYKVFLEHLKDQETRVLYDCLLQLPGQLSLSSGPRIELLYKLGEAFPDVFHFVRMPFDGPLIKVDNLATLESYKDCVKAEIKKSIDFPRDQSNEFIFGSTKISNAVNKHYESIIDLAYRQISNVYQVSIAEDADPKFIVSEKEKKQVFMMFVQTLLRSVLIKELDVGYYGNVCKHSSDRGAAATGCDVILSHVLTNTLEEHLMDVRLLVASPAFIAKSSAVEESRAAPLDAFARFMEMVYSQGKRQQLVDAYKEAGLPDEEAMSYYKPKIYYPQVGIEIHTSIQGQDAKREFSLDITCDFSQPQDQLLSKLLEVFEDQYALSFARIGDEGVIPKPNNDEEKVDYHLAESRFVVNDVRGETYGELTFRISFPASDLTDGSNVLHATITSKLEAVFPSRSDVGIEEDRPL